jgi:cytochrome b6-f complex iron-sulfur subunit
MNRREFTRWLTIGAIASSLPVALAACGSGSNSSSGSNASPTASGSPLPPPQNVAAGSVAATVSALDTAGFLNIAVDGKAATLVRNPDKKDEIIAVNTTCTHKGCIVAWDASKKSHVCPCHGAMFDATGKVTNAPATTPLKRYTVKVDGDNITVS